MGHGKTFVAHFAWVKKQSSLGLKLRLASLLVWLSRPSCLDYFVAARISLAPSEPDS
jgi:hypothetical protein